MKLGILCTMTNGFGRKGFYNTQEIGLGRALWRQGHEVDIYKCLLKGEQPETKELEKGFRIHYLSMPSIGAHAILDTSVLPTNLDGILCFADNQLFLPHVYRFCRKHNIAFVPYIGTTHSLYSSMKGRISDFLLAIGTMRIYRKHPLLAKTEGARQELKELGITNVTLAPVGLDDGVLHKNTDRADVAELRREYGFEPDDVVICNVSRMEPEKRVLELIDLFDRIKDQKKFRLLIIGEGSLAEPAAQKVRTLGLEDRIKLVARVPYTDMWKIYTLSDYYVNMNKGEIFGMAIMESVFYRTSVAASKAPGPCLTLKDMKGHCICEDDNAIERWLLAPYPNQELLQESSLRMIRDFSWNRTALAFTHLVEESKKAPK